LVRTSRHATTRREIPATAAAAASPRSARASGRSSKNALTSASPTGPDFSGWNCTAMTSPRCTAEMYASEPYVVVAATHARFAGVSDAR